MAIRVLVVEDNLLNMELLTDWLAAHGHTVLKAFNAPDGIKLAENERPDLILMDIALPGMDGVEATRILRSGETSEIPIIAVTASSMQVNLETLIEVGCEAVVFKPVDFKELREKIERVMSGHE